MHASVIRIAASRRLRSVMNGIRPATSADASAIARVHVETWRSVYAGLIPDNVLARMTTERQVIAWGRQIGDGAPTSVLVAESDKEVVGFIGIGHNRIGLAGFDGEVYTLYVLDDFQGRGLGARLLDAGFRALIDRRMNSAVIWVLAGNPSRFFYEAMGGQRVAERHEPLWGTVLHEAAYGWPDLAAFASRGSADE